MAESRSLVMSLDGSNYAAWKIQCKMALIKDGLWKIVSEEETAPESAAELNKFVVRRDRALAVIVLSLDAKLLYLLDDPVCPVVVWKKLADQFERKSWCNKLELRRKLYNLKLKQGCSVQSHIREITEIFNSLAVIGDVLTPEDKVVHLLASLPESYNMLVTAFEANSKVPDMEIVTERLIAEEMKQEKSHDFGDRALVLKKKFVTKCFHCNKPGHVKKNCWLLHPEKKNKSGAQTGKVNTAEVSNQNEVDNTCGFIVSHAYSVSHHIKYNDFIIDSGATCHMANNKDLFDHIDSVKSEVKVSVGDGRQLDILGQGNISLMVKLPNNQYKLFKLLNVKYVPELSYNLISVSKASNAGKIVNFSGEVCEFREPNGDLIFIAKKKGELYFLDCDISNSEMCNSASCDVNNLWHKRYGHLCESNLEKLAKYELVTNFDYNTSSKINLCDSCINGKITRAHFNSSSTQSTEFLELVHSDVCGKMNTKSLSNKQYFLTFIDDFTHYTWVYFLNSKDEVFEKFIEWKSEVENIYGSKLKTFRTDNGGEYCSKNFNNFLLTEGVRHEKTVPKTPQQNGKAERMNRTLVENVRAMLSDAKLPQKFWAEAMATCVYLRNRSPTTAILGKTPYEALTGKKPSVNNLKVFGCVAYAHIPNDERKKLDNKAKKCIMLGYGDTTKGYRLYDPIALKVIFSRDVIFAEMSRIEGNNINDNIVDIKPNYVYLPDSINDQCDIRTDRIDESVPGDVYLRDVSPPRPPIRRSARESHPPQRYGEWTTLVNVSEPKFFEDVINSPNKKEWDDAMAKEMQSLMDHNVWTVTELPPNKKPVSCKWIYKLKTDASGNISQYKARLVAQGFTQRQGFDYDEIFSPVVRLESLRSIVSISCKYGLKIHQMDVCSAFLNGDLREEIYMTQPDGFVKEGYENHVCKLRKSIYGLKQSARCWNEAIGNYLKELNFIQSDADPCVYSKTEGELTFICVYVDDIIIATESDSNMNEIKQSLSNKYRIKDLGELSYFLGVKVVKDHNNNSIWLGQPSYVDKLLFKFQLSDCKAVSTPAATDVKLVKSSDDEERCDKETYQSAIGNLLYLSSQTRPDITYAVSSVSRFCSDPSKTHWMAVKRIIRYLKGTRNYGLYYTKDKSVMSGYSDADWAGDNEDRRSTSGYVFVMCGAAVSWRSKKQPCVALSTAEAEYIALAGAVQECVWLQRLMIDLNLPDDKPTSLYEDNQAAIAISKNPQFHGRTKHIDIKFHYVREQVESGTVNLLYCPTNDMLADIFTKPLSNEKFVNFCKLIGVKSES